MLLYRAGCSSLRHTEITRHPFTSQSLHVAASFSGVTCPFERWNGEAEPSVWWALHLPFWDLAKSSRDGHSWGLIFITLNTNFLHLTRCLINFLSRRCIQVILPTPGKAFPPNVPIWEENLLSIVNEEMAELNATQRSGWMYSGHCAIAAHYMVQRLRVFRLNNSWLINTTDSFEQRFRWLCFFQHYRHMNYAAVIKILCWTQRVFGHITSESRTKTSHTLAFVPFI